MFIFSDLPSLPHRDDSSLCQLLRKHEGIDSVGGSIPQESHLASFDISLELDEATARPDSHPIYSELGATQSHLTQQNEHDTSQLSPPVLGYARLMAHADAGENRQQQENGREAQDRGCNHQGSAGLHIP